MLQYPFIIKKSRVFSARTPVGFIQISLNWKKSLHFIKKRGYFSHLFKNDTNLIYADFDLNMPLSPGFPIYPPEKKLVRKYCSSPKLWQLLKSAGSDRPRLYAPCVPKVTIATRKINFMCDEISEISQFPDSQRRNRR